MKPTSLQTALAELTPSQAEAVQWNGGPMFVLAGPGSGKTRVLTTRVSRLLGDTPKETFKVLALTFTNKAADEMTSRIISLVPEMERRAVIGTFHSFCMQLLQQHGSHVGISPDFTIYSLESDRQELMREVFREIGAQADQSSFLKAIDKLKSKLVPSEDCHKRFSDPELGMLVENAYKAYDALLSKNNALDFNSLIAQCYKLISKFPGIAQRIRKTYRYWLFDEFQDTTDGQYQLVKQLAGSDFKNIFCVADDDQIIYQWNGASYQQIQKFRSDFSPCEIQLPTNYRCPPLIVTLANNLVVHNKQRSDLKKPLEAGKTVLQYADDQQLTLARFTNDSAEASSVASSVSELGKERWGEVAILARTKSLLEKAHESLLAMNVTAVIAQRRDDFLSPAYQWMCAVLKLSLRPLDKMAFESMVGSFNRWFNTRLKLDDVFGVAELSSRTFLEEWGQIIGDQCNELSKELVSEAVACSQSRGKYRSFIDFCIKRFEVLQNENTDLYEDRLAWDDISRNVNRTIGSDAPLELFLQELAIRSKEPPVKPGTVVLMTIHAAKGKEFDHVYVIGMAEDVLPSYQSNKAGTDSPEMEEERRNCFVAITRVKERLHLSFANQYRGYSKKPSRFLLEMGLSTPTEVVA